MSYQAMAWAIEQDVESPSARCVLMSIANYANEDWCAWPKQELIAREGVQSVDSVQRRMPDLLARRLVRRIKLKRFGRRTHDFYILPRSRFFEASIEDIRPLLPSGVDVIEEAEATAICGSANGDETPAPLSESGSDAAADCGDQNDATLPQSAPHATAVVRQPMNEPVRNQEDSPLPPKGGLTPFDEDGWKAFETAWQEPILRQGLARDEWTMLKPADKALATKAACGYVAWRKSQRKPPNVLNAHSFLRERDAWARFAELAPGKTKPSALARPKIAYPRDSREGIAISQLFAICRAPISVTKTGEIEANEAVTPQVLALADIKEPAKDWPVSDDPNQRGAWSRFAFKFIGHSVLIEDHVIDRRYSEAASGADPVFLGNVLKRGFKAPRPWPPKIDGTWSATAPDSECSDEELADFTR